MFLCDRSIALPAAIKSWLSPLPTNTPFLILSMSLPWCLASETKTTLQLPLSSFTSIIPPSGIMLEFETKRVCPNSGSTFFNASFISSFFMPLRLATVHRQLDRFRQQSKANHCCDQVSILFWAKGWIPPIQRSRGPQDSQAEKDFGRTYPIRKRSIDYDRVDH